MLTKWNARLINIVWLTLVTPGILLAVLFEGGVPPGGTWIERQSRVGTR